MSYLLVFNCGSSSIKFSLIDIEQPVPSFSGTFENVGKKEGRLSTRYKELKESTAFPHQSYEKALTIITSQIEKRFPFSSIIGVGHRVVHGGNLFQKSTRIDERVCEKIASLSSFAPLHNPIHLQGIRHIQKAYPTIPQVAVFDTAFHQTMEKEAFLYPLPYSLYETFGIRRFGFHGISHHFISQRFAQLTGRPIENLNILSAHLGNGCSVTAIKGGKSIDTSMGFTPLEGLMMGTRSGSIDPGLFSPLCQMLGKNVDEITTLLNQQSGLLGISGMSHDMRELEEKMGEGNERATLAISMFTNRVAKMIGALYTTLPRVDALIFTGGIGENSPLIRQKVVDHLPYFSIDKEQKPLREGNLSPQKNPSVWVIPTNEELLIARETAAAIKKVS